MNGNGFGDGKSFLDNKEFFEAAAGVAMIFAGASLLLANPQTRQYVKDGLKAFFPNTDLDKLEDPASEILDKLWETQWEENLLDVAKTRVKRRVEPRLFQIYDLSVHKEWPPAQVAAALDVPIGQVYLVKHRVADFIKEELKRLDKSVN